MTIALAIKCSDGIVLASDSQSSTDKTNLTVTKIHKTKSNLGLSRAWDFNQVFDLVNFLQKQKLSESDGDGIFNRLKFLFITTAC